MHFLILSSTFFDREETFIVKCMLHWKIKVLTTSSEKKGTRNKWEKYDKINDNNNDAGVDGDTEVRTRMN